MIALLLLYFLWEAVRATVGHCLENMQEWMEVTT